MTGFSDDVTRTLAGHYIAEHNHDGTKLCACGVWFDDGLAHRAHLADALSAVADSRLADAEAKVERVEKHMAFRERLGSDSSPHYEIRAALSGGDTT